MAAAAVAVAPRVDPRADFPAWLSAQGMKLPFAQAMERELGIGDYEDLLACAEDAQVTLELLATARQRLPFALYAALRRLVKTAAAASSSSSASVGPAGGSPRGPPEWPLHEAAQPGLAALLEAIVATLRGLGRELEASVRRFSALEALGACSPPGGGGSPPGGGEPPPPRGTTEHSPHTESSSSLEPPPGSPRGDPEPLAALPTAWGVKRGALARCEEEEHGVDVGSDGGAASWRDVKKEELDPDDVNLEDAQGPDDNDDDDDDSDTDPERLPVALDRGPSPLGEEHVPRGEPGPGGEQAPPPAGPPPFVWIEASGMYGEEEGRGEGEGAGEDATGTGEGAHCGGEQQRGAFRSHRCEECGREFGSHSHLVQHRIIHTGEKPYGCGECGQRFNRKHHLSRHARTHTGERPHVCPECGASFAQSSDLNRHRRRHGGQRPHACGACGKRFAQAGDLARHRMRHTGERPYCCPDCGKGFIHPTSLINHRKGHASGVAALSPPRRPPHGAGAQGDGAQGDGGV